MNYRPVFIAGCDRSGTTLLGDLLGCSPWAITTPESQFVHELLLHLQLNSFDTPRAATHWLVNHFRYAAWDLPLNTAELEQLLNLDDPRATIETIVKEYVKQFHADKLNADVWVDHTPDNFKYYSQLKSLFPDARFIHIVRDGRAVCASIRGLDWGPNNAYMASRHWAERLQQALIVEGAEADNCVRVRYEDLLTRPHEILAQLCEFIDIPFDETMTKGGGLVVPDFTRTQHDLVGQAPKAEKAYQWRSKLSKQDLRDFESYPFSHLFLNKMGYKTEFESPPQLSAPHILYCYTHEFLSYLFNRFRHRRMEHRVVARIKKLQERKTTENLTHTRAFAHASNSRNGE